MPQKVSPYSKALTMLLGVAIIAVMTVAVEAYTPKIGMMRR